jgi:hypothetical protein
MFITEDWKGFEQSLPLEVRTQIAEAVKWSCGEKSERTTQELLAIKCQNIYLIGYLAGVKATQEIAVKVIASIGTTEKGVGSLTGVKVSQ